MKPRQAPLSHRTRNTFHVFQLLWQALKKFDQDHGFLLSSGIAFDLLLCLVPLLLLLLAVAGVYLYSEHEVLDSIERHIESLFPSMDTKIMEDILVIVQDREMVGVVGFAGLLWTSTWVFSGLRTALNIVFQVPKGRGILRGKAVDLFMILMAALFLLASMFLTSAIAFIQGYPYPFRLPIDIGPILQWVLKYALPLVFTFWIFFLIYKIVPNRKIHFKTALKAAFFAGFLWETAKQLFGWYVLHLSRFSVVYGSLSALAIFFIWIYYSAAILLLGGEVASLMEEGRKRI